MQPSGCLDRPPDGPPPAGGPRRSLAGGRLRGRGLDGAGDRMKVGWEASGAAFPWRDRCPRTGAGTWLWMGHVFPGGRIVDGLSEISVSKAPHLAAGTTGVIVHGLRSCPGEPDVAEAALAHALEDAVSVASQPISDGLSPWKRIFCSGCLNG